MSALLVGVLVVLVASAGFAVSLFGRRPLPQPAMQTAATVPNAVTSPSRGGGRITRAARKIAAIAAGDEVDAPPPPSIDVEIPATTRARSVLILAAGVIGTAAVVGVLLSVAVIALSTLLT
jgi:hypothetical protein